MAKDAPRHSDQSHLESVSFGRAEAAAARYGSIHRRWVGRQQLEGPVTDAVAVTPTVSIAAVSIGAVAPTVPVTLASAPGTTPEPAWPAPSGRPPFKTLVGIPVSSVGTLADQAWLDTPRSPAVAPPPSPSEPSPSASSDSPQSRALPAVEPVPLTATAAPAATADVDLTPLRGKRSPARALFISLGIAGAIVVAVALRGTPGSDAAPDTSVSTTPGRRPADALRATDEKNSAAQIAAPQQPSRTAAAPQGSASQDGATSEAVAKAGAGSNNAEGTENAGGIASVKARTSSAAAVAQKPATSKDAASKDALRTKVKMPRQKPPRKTVRGGIIRQNPF